jgi:hypothetical protein
MEADRIGGESKSEVNQQKTGRNCIGQHFLMLERIFQRNSITFEDDYLRFPGYICDSRNLFAILKFYLRFLKFICDPEFLFAIPEIYLRS